LFLLVLKEVGQLSEGKSKNKKNAPDALERFGNDLVMIW
jgi:hypothetical protein